jgi:hypothetical protein
MSNWVENQLYIWGLEKDLDPLRCFLKIRCDVNKLFSVLIPYPKEWAEMDKEHDEIINLDLMSKNDTITKGKQITTRRLEYCRKYNLQGFFSAYHLWGYDWRHKNWGTCDDVFNLEVIDFYRNGLLLNFNTSWTSPIIGIQKLMEKFDKLSCELLHFNSASETAGGLVILSEVEYSDRGHKNWSAGEIYSQWLTDNYKGIKGG